MGHLVSPLDAAGYDESFKKWRYDELPILPEPFRYVTAPGKEDAFENLRSLMGRPAVMPRSMAIYEPEQEMAAGMVLLPGRNQQAEV